VNRVREASGNEPRARAAFLPAFYAVFCFARRSFSLESAAEFAVGGVADASKTGKKETDNGEGSDEVADHPGYR
jgi:hypothetical protein